MSTNDRDSNHKLVDIIRPSERLSSLLQNAATKTRPETTSLELCTAVTLIRPTPPSIKAVISEFTDVDSEIRLRRQTFTGKTD
jgi:hypothetical protein